jgi:hypothetical protein
MNKHKDFAKFLSGFAANKIFTLAVLGASNVLPITVFGFTLTPQINFWILLGWGAVMIFCIYYAWFKK